MRNQRKCKSIDNKSLYTSNQKDNVNNTEKNENIHNRTNYIELTKTNQMVLDNLHK